MSSLADRGDAPRLVVVGGGPAGLAAAIQAEGHGFDVTVLDEGVHLGGQYFRGRGGDRSVGSPAWFNTWRRHIAVLTTTSVIDVDVDGRRLVTWSAASGTRPIGFDCLILCTGAYDRAVALPGWTLPGVMTAGGALTFAKSYHASAGQRIAIGGSGPFLLPVAVAIARLGATVTVFEATHVGESMSGVPALIRDREVLAQAVAYRVEMAARGARFFYGRMITEIRGDQRASSIVHHAVDANWRPTPDSARSLAVDGVCLGFGFTPRVELAELLGCELDYDDLNRCHQVRVDERQHTTQPFVYAAGEATGIGGARVASLEGRKAATAAAADVQILSERGYARWRRQIEPRLRAARRTQAWLTQAFRPREGLWQLAHSTDVVCRCEEVQFDQVESALRANSVGPRPVKSSTRAGMGLCQGAICAPLITELLRSKYGYQPRAARDWSVRPPLRPVPMRDWPLVDKATGA